MKMKDFQQKNDKGEFSDQEWESLAKDFINEKFDAEKRQRIKEILAKNGIHRSHSSFNRNWLAVAASLLILVAVGGYLFSNQLPSSQNLALDYLDAPFEFNEQETRIGGGNLQALRGKATEAYDQQEYEKALKYLQEIESQEQIKIEDYFLMGLCLIYKVDPNYENALVVFDKIRSIDSTKYTDEMNWLSGLCALMIDDEERAKLFLQKVVNSPSSRKNQDALLLLEKIE